MPARKMRVELFDEDGDKYTISFEGRVTRDKATRLLDLVELLGGASPNDANSAVSDRIGELSKYDRVHILVREQFPITWFSSSDVQNGYESEFKEPIRLSTISTYLSRMVTRGVLVRAKTSRRLRYKVSAVFPRAPRQRVRR